MKIKPSTLHLLSLLASIATAFILTMILLYTYCRIVYG